MAIIPDERTDVYLFVLCAQVTMSGTFGATVIMAIILMNVPD
jgi:hypothetical protein